MSESYKYCKNCKCKFSQEMEECPNCRKPLEQYTPESETDIVQKNDDDMSVIIGMMFSSML